MKFVLLLSLVCSSHLTYADNTRQRYGNYVAAINGWTQNRVQAFGRMHRGHVVTRTEFFADQMISVIHFNTGDGLACKTSSGPNFECWNSAGMAAVYYGRYVRKPTMEEFGL